MLTTTEAGARLGIRPRSVTLLCRRGTIQAQKLGRDWLIPEAEVERYLVERRPAHRPKKGDDTPTPPA